MMLRQLLWVCVIPIFNVNANYVVQPDFDECDRSQCSPIDEIFKSNIDSKAEPCDDFFKYACGKNFTRHTTLGIDTSETYLYTENQDFNDLQKLLGEPFLSTSDNNIDALKIEREIYERCQKGTHTHQEKQHYEKLLVKYKANRLTQHYHESNDNEPWTRTDLKYALAGFGFAFFDIDIIEREPFYTGELKRYIQISPTSDNVLDMNDLLTTKYMNLPERRGFRNSHANYNYNNHRNSEDKYSQLKHFINELNKIIPYEKYDDSSRNDKSLETPKYLSEWQKRYNEFAYDGLSKIDWTNLLKEYFAKIHLEITENEYIFIKDENYFLRLAETLRLTHNFNTIVDYIHLRFVSKTIGFVEKEYQEKYSIIPPIKGLFCTPGLLVGTAHVYMQRYFPKDNKEIIEGIFTAVKEIIQRQLRTDEYNLAVAYDITKNFLRQLSTSNIIIGYPDWLANETIVSKFYDRHFPISEFYYANQIKFVEILLKNKLKSYYDYSIPIFDIKSFLKLFTQRNIEFSRDLNQITFPPRVFNENTYKFLSAQLFDPINYGAAGTNIASKIYLEWLRRINYSKCATKCVLQQMPGDLEKRKADEYLLRATSYLLGLRTAYEAWPTKDSYPIHFQKFGAITDYRVFFLSFAESMCRTQVQRNEIKPYAFINFAVSNTKEFTEAFQCYKRHTMNRQYKCNPLKK